MFIKSWIEKFKSKKGIKHKALKRNSNWIFSSQNSLYEGKLNLKTSLKNKNVRPTKDKNLKATQNSKTWRFDAWFLVSAFKWVFCWYKPVLAYKEPWMQGNGLNEFRTIVYEVSSFENTPLTTPLNTICTYNAYVRCTLYSVQ